MYPNSYSKLDITRDTYEIHNIIKVKIPEVNNDDIIFHLLRDYTEGTNTYCMYFHTERLYQQFCKVYLEKNSGQGPKLIRCTEMVNTVTDIEQIMLVKHHHEGKTNHRGINETLEQLKRNYYRKNMKNSVTNFVNECNVCQRSKYARQKHYTPLMLTEQQVNRFKLSIWMFFHLTIKDI